MILKSVNVDLRTIIAKFELKKSEILLFNKLNFYPENLV